MYIAVTAAVGCFLGVRLAQRADTEALEQVYGEFQAEAHQSNPEYCPESVNTDGWNTTQQDGVPCFQTSLTIVLCFLHVVLGVQQLCRRTSSKFPDRHRQIVASLCQ